MAELRRVLGIDPGSRITGYGVIDSDGRQSRHVASGCIHAETGEMAERLGRIYQGVSELIQRFHPQVLAIEEVFVAQNPSSALKLGQARGAAICAAVGCGLPVSEYSARAVKLSVVGTGSADKAQVQQMVRLLLGLSALPATDAADALAVALSHAHTDATKRRLAQAGGGGR